MNFVHNNKKCIIIAYIFKGGKGGGLRNEFTNNNFAFFASQETNSTFDLCHTFGGDLCMAINSLGKSTVGGSKHTEVLSYIKRLQRKVFSRRQMLL